MTTTIATSDWRELDSRAGDGLQVTLLWSKAAGRLKVAVADLREGAGFDLDVERDDDALFAFRHPFAYTPRHA